MKLIPPLDKKKSLFPTTFFFTTSTWGNLFDSIKYNIIQKHPDNFKLLKI
jgi:hypothetical protein